MKLNHWRSISMEAHDFGADATCPTRFDFMLVPEEVNTSSTTAVIKSTLGKYTEKCTLSSINIPQNSNSYLNVIFCGLWLIAYQQHIRVTI